jgi:uncharacterized protein involved in exopolysaccharide biosynthesis
MVGVIEMLSGWWRFIAGSVLVGGLVATGISLLITPQFKSTASVFTSEKADLFGAIEGVSGLMKSFTPRGLAGFAGNVELDRYMAILKSGRVVGEVIRKFDLVNVYGITSYPGEKTAKRLMENTEFVIEPEGNLTVSVYDEDPQRASDMANYFVEELNRANSELQVQNARGNRKFIEDRYAKNLADLAAAEDSLRAFQKRYGVIAMPQQTEASIKAGSEIAAQLAMKEVQLEVLKRMQSGDHPLVVAAQVEIDEFRKKIAEMNSGRGLRKGEMNALVPFAAIPDLGADYLRRFRDVEIQYKILQYITPLFEQAKVEEQRQTPSVIVLDRAVPAERKARPKRMLIVLGGMFVCLIGSVGAAGIVDKWRRERETNSPMYHALAEFGRSVRDSLRPEMRGRV